MAKTVTLKSKSDKIPFDPMRTIQKIHWAGGTDWLMIAITQVSPSFLPGVGMWASFDPDDINAGVSVDEAGNDGETHLIPFGAPYYQTSEDLALEGGYSVNKHESFNNNPAECFFLIKLESFKENAGSDGILRVYTTKGGTPDYYANRSFWIATIAKEDMVAGLAVPEGLPFVSQSYDNTASATSTFAIDLETLEVTLEA